jgi:hypothetical protein
MTFNKTIDLMRQIWEMLVSVKPEHPLRAQLQQAEALLRRDIVEHSLALGFAPIELPEIARGELEAAKAARPAGLLRGGRAAQGTAREAEEANEAPDPKKGKGSSRRSPASEDGHDPPGKKGVKRQSRRAPRQPTGLRSNSGLSPADRGRPSSSS